jgi:hypothetical protein
LSAAFASADIISIVEEMDEESGMTGIRGYAGDVIGGPTGQIFGKGVGRFVTSAITGVDPEQLQSFKTRLTMLTNPLISVITGEEGRYTKEERDETKEASAALKVAKSYEQIKGALFSILESYAMRLAKVGFVLGRPIDVTTQAGILKEYRRLRGIPNAQGVYEGGWGFSSERAIRVIKKIQHAQGELSRLKSLNPEEYREITGQ